MTPLKLLVVEDDTASLELMTEVFTYLKAEVRPVSDSEKATSDVATSARCMGQPSRVIHDLVGKPAAFQASMPPARCALKG